MKNTIGIMALIAAALSFTAGCGVAPCGPFIDQARGLEKKKDALMIRVVDPNTRDDPNILGKVENCKVIWKDLKDESNFGEIIGADDPNSSGVYFDTFSGGNIERAGKIIHVMIQAKGYLTASFDFKFLDDGCGGYERQYPCVPLYPIGTTDFLDTSCLPQQWLIEYDVEEAQAGDAVLKSQE